MARPEVTGRKGASVTQVADIPYRGPPDDVDAFTVEEFCRRHRISVQLFYKYRNTMPDTFSVGARVLISREAAERWRRQKEAEPAP
jgi:hypothetical protein